MQHTVVNNPVRSHAGLLRQWSIPLALLACVVLAFFDKISITVLFADPGFQQELGVAGKPGAMGALMTGFLLSYGVSSALLSVLGDLVSPKRCLIVLMLGWAVLMALMGLVHSYTLLLWLRIALGVAEGPLFALAYAIVKRTFPPERQARATMLWLLGTPIGAALGYPITSHVLQAFDWHATFFVLAALTFVVIALVAWVLRGVELRARPRRVQAGASHEGRLRQQRQAIVQLFGNRHFWAVCLFNVAFLTCLWGIMSWLPTYLHEGKGIDLKAVGTFASLPFIGMLLGEVVGSFVSDRLDRRALQCFISLFATGLGLLLVLGIDSHMPMILVLAFSQTMWGVGAPTVFALLAKVVPAEVSATAGGIFNGAGNIAGAAAPWLIGVLIAQTGGASAGILFLAIAGLLGGLVLLPLVRRY